MVDIYQLLLQIGAIKKGEFILRSGKKSNYYVDIKESITDPKILNILISSITEQLNETGENPSAIAGMELGAVPLIVALSLKLNIPYIIIRKEKKEYGISNRIIGKILSGQIAIIEDVVTTGKTVSDCISLLRENGAIVKSVYAIVDRNEGGESLLSGMGVNLHALVKMGANNGSK
jgi:orotate phosphoribosyltransferase